MVVIIVMEAAQARAPCCVVTSCRPVSVGLRRRTSLRVPVWDTFALRLSGFSVNLPVSSMTALENVVEGLVTVNKYTQGAGHRYFLASSAWRALGQRDLSARRSSAWPLPRVLTMEPKVMMFAPAAPPLDPESIG